MVKKKIFIGVAWPYVNGDIHIGHLAGYLLPADIFARFHRFLGNDVLMVSGSDCFGTPITIEADKKQVRPQDIVSEYHSKNVQLFEKLRLSFDKYTKTDTKNHRKITQDFFIKLLEKELIFKNKTEQYFSPSENRFLPDRYVEGECSNCGYKESRSDQCDGCGKVLKPGELKNPKSKLTRQSVELKLTEHYFLNWPKLQSFLASYVKNNHGWRKWVLDETKGWLKKGLEPRAITRDLDWGVEIPIDRIPKNLQIDNCGNKRIYVWFDAVIGYFSASLEWNKNNWKNWWQNKSAEHYYFMGKDNLVFHTLFWPGQLHGYDEKLHLPDKPVINQFLNLDGQKFSKSRGVTISSDYMADVYGVDVLRFYLCLIMPENADANFTWPDFVAKNNNILIGNFGNFVNRALTLGKSLDFNGVKIGKEIEKITIQKISEAKSALLDCEFKKYLAIVLSLSDYGNKYIAKKEPWAIKNNPKKFKEIIGNSAYIVLALQMLIKPLMPETTEKLSNQLSIKIASWPENVGKFLEKNLAKIKIKNIQPLFKKLDEKIIEQENVKIRGKILT